MWWRHVSLEVASEFAAVESAQRYERYVAYCLREKLWHWNGLRAWGHSARRAASDKRRRRSQCCPVCSGRIAHTPGAKVRAYCSTKCQRRANHAKQREKRRAARNRQ